MTAGGLKAKPPVTGSKGVGRKSFRGGATGKKTENSTIKLLLGGRKGKKQKIAKHDRKIALLSFYLLYLCHV